MNDRQPSLAWEDLVQPKQPAPSKEELTATYLTHELRAPLTAVYSALCLLKEQALGKLSDEERDLLRNALRNADRLASLIDDIMDYSKIKEGKVTLKRQPVGPRQIIGDAAVLLNPWAISRGLKLVRAVLDEPLPRVDADRKRAGQILTNLLSNAIKFTPKGGTIEVGAEAGAGMHKGTVVFWVRDTGSGIAPEDQERIFRCFEQAANGLKVSAGTGLGLTIAKAMVELHGGKIWVESAQGAGSTFKFTIPVSRQDLARPLTLYPKPVEYHGILVNLFRRFNAVLALLVP